MLSGEGNAGDRRKTTIGLNSKKKNNNNNFPHAAHFFFFFSFPCRCLARLQRKTSRNRFFMGEMSYVLSFTFFHCRSFSPYIGGRQHFSFCRPCYKIFILASNKKCLLFFISRSRSLSPFFPLSFAGLSPTLSFSLSFSCSMFQICGHDH